MLKLFSNLKKREWIYIVISLVFILAQVWLDLTMPDYMSEITMLVQTPGSAMSDIWIAGGKMLLCAFGSLAASIITSVFAAKAVFTPPTKLASTNKAIASVLILLPKLYLP